MILRTCAAVCLATAMTTLVSCEQRTEVGTPNADAAGEGRGSQENASFTRGFYKEEVTPAATIRWVHQEGAFALTVPTAGKYRLGFKTITVFAPGTIAIQVGVNGEPAGSITTEGFDMAKAATSNLEVTLRAGANEISLKADRPEVRLSSTDVRTAAFGLILPVAADLLR